MKIELSSVELLWIKDALLEYRYNRSPLDDYIDKRYSNHESSFISRKRSSLIDKLAIIDNLLEKI